MAKPRDPLFLERSGYRRRRVLDALRLLVFLGVALWMTPLLWPNAADAGGGRDVAGISMSVALAFVFGVWIVLILLSALLTSGRIMPEEGKPAEARDRLP